MSLRVSRHWTLPYWLAAAALFVLVWSRQWGPEPSTAATLLLHLAASAGEMLVVQLLLGHPRPILAKQLAAVLLATLATASPAFLYHANASSQLPRSSYSLAIA